MATLENLICFRAESKMRFNPERVSQQSLGSPQRGAPLVVLICDPNPNGVSHGQLRMPKAIVEPRSGFKDRTLIGTQGAPLHGDPGLCCVTPLGFSKRCFAVFIVHEAQNMPENPPQRCLSSLRVPCVQLGGLTPTARRVTSMMIA